MIRIFLRAMPGHQVWFNIKGRAETVTSLRDHSIAFSIDSDDCVKTIEHIEVSFQRRQLKILRVVGSSTGDLKALAALSEVLGNVLQSEGQMLATTGSPSDAERSRRVFVIHGRNLSMRSAVFSFVRSIGLQPIEWSQARDLTSKPYVFEIVRAAFDHAQAFLVLMTPDEYVELRTEASPCEIGFQARPNVLFEAGMALALHPQRTVIVEAGTLRPFTDVGGILTIKLDNTTERRQDLAAALKRAGCAVDIEGREWHRVGDLDVTPAPRSGGEKA